MSLPADGSLERDTDRGARAREVIENPIYQESYDSLEKEIYAQWRDARDSHDREQLHQLLLMLGKARNALETVMRTGDLAQAELQRKRSRAEQIGSVYHKRWAA